MGCTYHRWAWQVGLAGVLRCRRGVALPVLNSCQPNRTRWFRLALQSVCCRLTQNCDLPWGPQAGKPVRLYQQPIFIS